MADNLNDVLRKLKDQASSLKKYKEKSDGMKGVISAIEKAQCRLYKYQTPKTCDLVSQLDAAKKDVNNAIDAAGTYIDIVAEILGENTVSEEVLAFLRVENRLTDLNMAEVSLFEVGEYGALKSRPGRDGMEMDHIPSKAALCKATCRYIENKIDKKLNDMEVAAVLQVVEKLGGAIAVPKEMHDKLSRTIGGRNAKTRIHQDSLDIIRAIKADLEAYTPELRKRGYSDKDIEMIYNNLVKRFNHVMEQICQQK
jgi:complete genome; segment 3/17